MRIEGIPALCDVFPGPFACYVDNLDVVFIGPRAMTTDETLWFVLAHEMAHASGAEHRLGRATLKRADYALVSRTRIEEAIADAVATALTGIPRSATTLSDDPKRHYVNPDTMRGRYVRHHAERAIAYMQIRARVEGTL